MNIAEGERALINAVQKILTAGGIDDPQLESERILDGAQELGSPDKKELAIAMARTRANGTPLSYVLGRQRFMGIELSVNPGS